MVEPLRAELVQAVQARDDAALQRLYAQIAVFAREHPAKHAKLPAPLVAHAARQSTSADLLREWAAQVKAHPHHPGPTLWPLWSHHLPASSKDWRALQRKAAESKKKVDRFEKWYAEFEALNGTIVEQLNTVYQRLRAEGGDEGGAPPLALDEVAQRLLDLTSARSAASALPSTTD